MIRSKEYSVEDIDKILEKKGLVNCKKIFSPTVFDENSQLHKDIVACLEKSDLTSGWLPVNAVTLFHSQKDEIAPMENCEKAYVGLVGGNVELEWAALSPNHDLTGALYYLNFMGINIVAGVVNSFFRGL